MRQMREETSRRHTSIYIVGGGGITRCDIVGEGTRCDIVGEGTRCDIVGEGTRCDIVGGHSL